MKNQCTYLDRAIDKQRSAVDLTLSGGRDAATAFFMNAISNNGWPQVVNLAGPRQVGKTTLIRNLFGSGRFISLDDAAILTAIAADQLYEKLERGTAYY